MRRCLRGALRPDRGSDSTRKAFGQYYNIHPWVMIFQCISSILDCLAAQSRWQLCIWSDAPKCCLGFQDLSISWPCWSSWSRKLNSITKRIVGYTSVSGALQIHCVCTWLPLASRLKCYLSSLIHVQSGCYPSNPEHERKRAKTVINHTTTWSNSEQFASNLKRGRNIVNDWRSCKSGRATSKDISKWRNWHHNISQLRKSSDESPLNFHFNFVDFCPTVGNLLFTAECRRHKTRTRQVDLQNLCKSLSLQNLREISQPFFAVFLTFPCLLEVKSNAKKS